MDGGSLEIVRECIGRRKAEVTGWLWNSWGVDFFDGCLLVWIRVIFTSSILFFLASVLASEGFACVGDVM